MAAVPVKWFSDEGAFGASDSSRGMSPGKDLFVHHSGIVGCGPAEASRGSDPDTRPGPKGPKLSTSNGFSESNRCIRPAATPSVRPGLARQLPGSCQRPR